MNKKLIIAVAVAAVVVVAIALVVSKRDGKGGNAMRAQDPRNATYTVDGEVFAMKNGEAIVQIEPGVTATYKYFSQAEGLLNEDTVDDFGVLLTADGGGSGTFYYAVALVSTEGGLKETNAILLGDRIIIKASDVGADTFTVDYLDRKSGEPFTTAPSVAKTKSFQVRKGVLTEVK